MVVTQRPFIIWIFGLPSAGKSTLAQRVHIRLAAKGEPSLLLDGDDLRRGLCEGLGFSDRDREENLRRAAEVAALGARSGVSSVVAMITPLNTQRAIISRILSGFPLHWVWLSCPLNTCVKRDVKGLYQRHSQNAKSKMTGLHSPFEPPHDNALNLDTSELSVDEAVELIMAYLDRGN